MNVCIFVRVADVKIMFNGKLFLYFKILTNLNFFESDGNKRLQKILKLICLKRKIMQFFPLNLNFINFTFLCKLFWNFREFSCILVRFRISKLTP